MIEAQAAEPTYWQDVRPLLRKHCTVCHSQRNVNEVDVSGGLAFDNYEAVTRNPKRTLLKPGKSADSLLVKITTTANAERRMPLGGKPLPDDAIALLRNWIDTGAKEGDKPADDPVAATPKSTRPRRKLDVALDTTAVPPKGLLGPAAPAPLRLTLPIGPLPPVTAVAFSPDGKQLAAGTFGFATIWDLETGKPAKVLTNVLGSVSDLKYSPDGKVLAVAGGQPSAKGEIRLFQVVDWKLLATLGGHEDVVASVSFRFDGKKLASASFDRTVRVWDLAAHKQERVLTGHSDFVYAVAYSPDGKLLASASKDRSVKLVEADTGKSRFTFSGMNEEVFAVAYHPDGKQIVSSGIESNTYWWDPQTGSRTKLGGGHRGATQEAAFTRDGKVLATGSMDGTVILWNAGTVAILKTLSAGSPVYAAAISADGKRVAAGSFDGLVRVWDGDGNRLQATLLSLHPTRAEPEWLALTPEGYAGSTAGLMKAGQWRMGKENVAADAVWKAIVKPDGLAQSLRGTAPPPVFGGK